MRKLHAKSALLPDGWAEDVLIAIGKDGRLESVQAGSAIEEGAERVAILLPALSNLHSHAFQRALAGLTEVKGNGDDDFWSWRETMYAFLPRLGPDEVESIAAMLYAELAESGFAAVAEFHYLHHQPDGSPFDDLAEMAGRIAAAAQTTGLGLTLLPVAYARSGFGGAPAHEGQRRFANSPDRLLALRQAARQHLTRPDDGLGIAPHSLRAVSPEDLDTLLRGAQDGPIHIHIAEQTREVEDCLCWSGKRPVEWLLENAGVDERWCLIHATHMTPDESRRLAAARAVAGLCPTTEADLGDGIFPGPDYLSHKGRWGVGTDSHVRTDAAEELRLLEWSQRLAHRQRTVLASAGQSNGAALYSAALAGGAQALGRPSGELARGCWADLVSLDPAHSAICGKSKDQILDGWIFAGDRSCVQHVWAAGRSIVRDGHHKDRPAITAKYKETMAALLT